MDHRRQRGAADPREHPHVPHGPPRAVAALIHGWTGHKDRNILPAVATDLAAAGLVAHRFTLSHAGVEKDADEITRLDEFERDSNAFCVADVRAVVEAVASGEIAGAGLPLFLVGHSRGGATAYRCAAVAVDADDPWPIAPAGLVSIAATATFTRLTPEWVRQLDEKGYVERECGRAVGGAVRMGRSWYAHHLDNPGRDLFAEAVAAVRCPCLVAHGTADTSVTIDHADTICGLLAENPHAPFTRLDVEGADHNFDVLGYGIDREDADNPRAMELKGAIRRFVGGAIGA